MFKLIKIESNNIADKHAQYSLSFQYSYSFPLSL